VICDNFTNIRILPCSSWVAHKDAYALIFVAPQIPPDRRPALSHKILSSFSFSRHQGVPYLLYSAAAPMWTHLWYNRPKGLSNMYFHILASLPVCDQHRKGRHLSFDKKQYPQKL
jgi:hypothetical protein